ncbi:MAG: choice-of-anchor D domain-containing protein, partial [Nitrospira sp.]|nr:choice-of-anchor D domain-containing protein [Nitrospira sp.]
VSMRVDSAVSHYYGAYWPSPLVRLEAKDGNYFLTSQHYSTSVNGFDFNFDLSAYSATSEQVLFSYNWADFGADQYGGTHPQWVFISVDGGATWVDSVHQTPTNNSDVTWVKETLDLSKTVREAGQDFTSEVVVRIQWHETYIFEHFFIDDIEVKLGPSMLVERPGTPISLGGYEVVGDVIKGQPLTVTYTITNEGHLDLELTGTPLVDFVNLTNCAVTLASPPAQTLLAPQASTTFDIEIDPLAAGTFVFEVRIPSNDLLKTPYPFVVVGNGLAPEIDVQRPVGNSIPDGTIENVGDAPAGNVTTYTYYILNRGGALLNLTGANLVDIQNISNCTATVITPPSGNTIDPQGFESFTVEVVPSLGTFTYDMVIANDDADEGNYTISVSGNGAITPEIEITRQGDDKLFPDGSIYRDTSSDPGMTRGVIFNINNNGNDVLNLTGTPLVQIANEDNVTATVTTQPAATVAVGGSTQFQVDWVPTAVGPYGFDIIVPNSDVTEGNYTIHVGSFSLITPKEKKDEGCSATSGSSWNWLALLGLLGLAAGAASLRARRE